MSLLDDLLRLQQEIRALEQLDQDIRLSEDKRTQSHGGLEDIELIGPPPKGPEGPGGLPIPGTVSTRQGGGRSTSKGYPLTNLGQPFIPTSKASMRPGVPLVTSGNQDGPEHAMWADYQQNTETPRLKDVPCANGANCYEDPPCYSNHDCQTCQQCLNWECVEKDWNRPCNTDIDCPCPPNEEQKFMCKEGACLLTCEVNDDCGMLGSGAETWANDLPPVDENGNPIPEDQLPAETCFACNQSTGFCGPGCTDDASCEPGGGAADSRPGSYCVDCSCITPCEAPRFCKSSSQCLEGEYCAEHFGRAPGDPAGATHSCAPGCDLAAPCPAIEVWENNAETGEDVLVSSRTPDCIDNQCILSCNSSDECLADEVCDDNECKVVGAICLFSEDCEDSQFCNSDGRCASGCRDDSNCDQTCAKDRDCVNRCTIDPTCTCEEITGGECEEGNYEWMAFCNKDPACVAQCPITEDCVEDFSRTCVENKCVKKCTSTAGCGKGFSCTYIDEENKSLGKECRPARDDSDAGEVDDRFGCNCGECCTQAGQCAPCICIDDSECEDCSYCKEGVCVPGCDEENPCPSGECCQNDGKCHLICSHDRDCPQVGYDGGPEQCLEGGCCGVACDPLVVCITQDNCEPGQYCDHLGYCQDGCREDHHCQHLWPQDIEDGLDFSDQICWQFSCERGCNSEFDCNKGDSCLGDDDCADDESCQSGFCALPSEDWTDFCNTDRYCQSKPTPLCKNDSECPERCSTDDDGNETCNKGFCFEGKCGQGCRSGNDCDGGDLCIEKQCKTPCSTNQDCKNSGKGNTCQGDPSARSGANARWQKCLAAVERLEADPYTPNWQVTEKKEQCDKLEDQARNAAGYCATVDGPPAAKEGRNGCECFEECDELGRCVPAECANDSDCDECGVSCLTYRTLSEYFPAKSGRFCGLCYSDSDCPGRSICDQPQDCDDDGNCVVEKDEETGKPLGGICAYTCIPEQPCALTTDCPPGNFCRQTETDKGIVGVCTTGCQNSGECVPGEVCIDGKCRPSCGDSGDCEEAHSCKTGGCVYTGYPCDDDGDCPQDLGWCKGSYCVPDNRCISNADCGGPDSDTKCVGGVCDERTNDPYEDEFSESVSIGCEACTDYCNPQKFLCEQIKCTTTTDCPCGFCGGRGFCIEECKNDQDCPDQGFCIEGSCYECKQDYHCRQRYEANLLADGDNFEGEEGYEWADQLVCKEGQCLTPCGAGLSDGDCYLGLNYGESCRNCPDSCPTGAFCEKIRKVDSMAKKWDPASQDWYYYPVVQEVCTGYCGCDSDCAGDDAYCVNGKCTVEIERCVVNSDCPGQKADTACDDPGGCGCPDDVEFRCLDNQCTQMGDQCITDSDCATDERCDLGACIVGECTTEEGCPEGKVCSSGKCRNMCDTEPMSCGVQPVYGIGEDGQRYVVGETEKRCPPGYNCDQNVCVSYDYIGLSERMGCGQGNICSQNACRPVIPGKFECTEDKHCQEPVDRAAFGHCSAREKKGTKAFWKCVDDRLGDSQHFCEEQLCKRGKKPCECPEDDPGCEECRPTEDRNEDDPEGTGCKCPLDSEGNQTDCKQCQDACQKIGKCCNEQGYCESCGCNEDSPCGRGECCDAETGKCFPLSEHRDTRFGAPKECSFGPVFCEVIVPAEDDGEPQAIYPSTDFDRGRLPGCEDDEACDSFGRCVPVKRCYDGSPLSDSQIEAELDKVCSKVEDDCECDDKDQPPSENECYEDIHCGSCQECVTKVWKGTACCPRYDSYIDISGNLVEVNEVRRNVCEGLYENYIGSAGTTKRDTECACQTDDDCTECEYCEASSSGTQGKCKIDCELCPAGGSTSVKGKECPNCEEQSGCLVTVESIFEEEKIDGTTGALIPAVTRSTCEIRTDSACCEGFMSVEEVLGKARPDGCLDKEIVTANGEVKVIQRDKCVDFKKGLCAQCLSDSDCRGTSVCRDYTCISQCGQENSAAMEQSPLSDTAEDLLGAYDPQDCSCCTEEGDCKEIYESWTESREFGDSQKCRPCACTEGGIDCQAWNDCRSCYQWVREDGEGQPDPDGTNAALLEEAQSHAQKLALEDQMSNQEAQIQQQQDNIRVQEELLQECYAFNNASKDEWEALCVNCDSPDFECREQEPPCPDCGPSHCQAEELVVKEKQGYVDGLNDEIDIAERDYEIQLGILNEGCPSPFQGCAPPEPDCRFDQECAADEICRECGCVPQECVFDYECPEGTDCVNGRCLAPGADPGTRCDQELIEQPDGVCCRWDVELKRDEGTGRIILPLPDEEYPNDSEGNPQSPCDITSEECGNGFAFLNAKGEELAALYTALDEAITEANQAQSALDACAGDAQANCDAAVAEWESKTEECRGLEETETQMQAALTQMLQNYETMQRKFLGLPDQHLGWRSVRVCDCCMDGMCREDPSDCAYGTCYMCPSEWVRERKPCYGLGFYGKVLKNLICMGMNSSILGREQPEACKDDPESDACPPPLFWEGISCHCSECPSEINDCSRVPDPGSNFIYYDEDPDMCIKYKCSDGLFRHDGLGSSCWDERYREWCTGSIISCALMGTAGRGYPDNVAKEYLNGWNFGCDDLGDIGTFYGNAASGALEDWVRFSGPDEDVAPITAKCRYPNRLAHIRGHELPTFIDDLAAHPCCNHAITMIGPHDDEPACVLTFEYFFESGDTSALLKRLEKELKALENYIGALVGAWFDLGRQWLGLDDQMLTLREEILEVSNGLEDAREDLDQAKKDKKDLEEDLEEINEIIDGDCDSQTINKRLLFPQCEMVEDEVTFQIKKDCESPVDFELYPVVLGWSPCINDYEDVEPGGLACAVEQYDAIRLAELDYQAQLIEARDGYQQQLIDEGCGTLVARSKELQREMSRTEGEISKQEGEVKTLLESNLNCTQEICQTVEDPDCANPGTNECGTVEICEDKRPIDTVPPYCCRCKAETEYDNEQQPPRLLIKDDECPVDSEGNELGPDDLDELACVDFERAVEAKMELLNEEYDYWVEIKDELNSVSDQLAECGTNGRVIQANVDLKNEEIEAQQSRVNSASSDFGCALNRLDEGFAERGRLNSELLSLNQQIEQLEAQVEWLESQANEYECYWDNECFCEKCVVKGQGEKQDKFDELYELKISAEEQMKLLCDCVVPQCSGNHPNTDPLDEPWVCTLMPIRNLNECCGDSEIKVAYDTYKEKIDEYDRLQKEYKIPVKPEKASYQAAKNQGKSAKEIRKWLKELTEADKAAKKKLWYPE